MEQVHSQEFNNRNSTVHGLMAPHGGNTFKGGLAMYNCVRMDLEENLEDTMKAHFENEIIEYLNQSFQGDLREKLIRFYLLYILMDTFPGFITSNDIGDKHFEETSYDGFKNTCQEELLPLEDIWKRDEEGGLFFRCLYKALDVVRPEDCIRYSFYPDLEADAYPIPDPFMGEDVKSWFAYFFYNEELRRVVIVWWSCTRAEL